VFPDVFSVHCMPTDLLHPSPAPHFKTLKVFLIHFPKCPKFQHHIKLCPKFGTFPSCFLKFDFNLLVKEVIFLLSGASTMAGLDLISHVNLYNWLSGYANTGNITRYSFVFWLVIICTGGGLVALRSALPVPSKSLFSAMQICAAETLT
jgi:hypothetical protein